MDKNTCTVWTRAEVSFDANVCVCVCIFTFVDDHIRSLTWTQISSSLLPEDVTAPWTWAWRLSSALVLGMNFPWISVAARNSCAFEIKSCKTLVKSAATFLKNRRLFSRGKGIRAAFDWLKWPERVWNVKRVNLGQTFKNNPNLHNL